MYSKWIRVYYLLLFIGELKKNAVLLILGIYKLRRQLQFKNLLGAS